MGKKSFLFTKGHNSIFSISFDLCVYIYICKKCIFLNLAFVHCFLCILGLVSASVTFVELLTMRNDAPQAVVIIRERERVCVCAHLRVCVRTRV